MVGDQATKRPRDQAIMRVTLSTLRTSAAEQIRNQLLKHTGSVFDRLGYRLLRVKADKHLMNQAGVCALQLRLADFAERWPQRV